MPQLSCHDLVLGYEGKTVVSGLTFSINEGDYLCIVGENGSGKSTLIKALSGLKAPMSGRIETDGLRRVEIGYLPQQTAIQRDFPASVREVVRSGFLNRIGLRPFYNREEKRMAEENMDRLGIASLAGRCYRELSGGQQQKVLLARALCATRKLLLLDEPVAGLDPLATQEMYTSIAQLNAGGITVIMVSHDVTAAVNYASHMLHIGEHSVQFFGPKGKYLESEVGQHYARRRGHDGSN
ncbi:MAG: ABC transporter ATP-binding protein [Lachnospiraceae bacterium]|jgi:zinc transport system ATP-binding protein|nr:ABC transporter ATP-binding protein [Lachnospiraceae bacterium]